MMDVPDELLRLLLYIDTINSLKVSVVNTASCNNTLTIIHQTCMVLRRSPLCTIYVGYIVRHTWKVHIVCTTVLTVKISYYEKLISDMSLLTRPISRVVIGREVDYRS